MAKKSSTVKSVYSKLNAEMGTLPPQAVEFEELVLGAAMLEKDVYYKIADILDEKMFYKESNGIIFSAIKQLAVNAESVDMVTVMEQLRKNNKVEEIGGPAYIANLTKSVGSGAHAEYHARIINQKFIQRELIRISSEIQERSFEDSEDVSDLLNFAEKEIFDIAQGIDKKETQPINVIIDEALELIAEASKRDDGLSGLASGFTELDKVTSGWQKSDLVIIAARPAMGKTAFILSMTRNMAVHHDLGVAFFSLEMSSVQLVNRMIVSTTHLDHKKIKNGRLEKWEWKQLEEKIEGLQKAPIFIDDTPALSIFELRAKVRRLKSQFKIDIIMVDYLQLMRGSDNSGNREQEVSMISRSLKAMAKEFNVPVITLSQLNRSVEMRGGDKKPQLSDLRESGAIEQDADMVMFIHRPEYYGLTENADGEDTRNLAELIIAKHRNGETGTVKLKFKKEYTEFSDWDSLSLDGDLSVTTVQSKLNNNDDAPALDDGFDAPNEFTDTNTPF